MATKQLTVQGAGSHYPVFIGRNLLESTLPAFVLEKGFTNVAIVTNDTVAPLYGEQLQTRIRGSYLITIADGEQHKTLATIQALYDTLLAHDADRSTLVIALGGGVTGDTAGFAAASFMRGVALVQVPTTLLAMVDASIGGKVGVDLPQGKNLVGAFKDPLAVFADAQTLETLPGPELRAGMAEVIKAGLIGDEWLLDCVPDRHSYEEIIARAASVKIGIVEQDQLESGIRAFLNLGHTFGHALEQVSAYTWRHGEAVAVGLVVAARLSERMGLCRESLAERVENALVTRGLPVRYNDYEPDALWAAMRRDKKWRGGRARFVLLEDVGKPVICDTVSGEVAIATIQSLREDNS